VPSGNPLVVDEKSIPDHHHITVVLTRSKKVEPKVDLQVHAIIC